MTRERYIICTTPRSGSNLLCDLLLGSGAMGRPREVFNIKATLVPVAKQHGLLDGEPGAVEMGGYLDLVLTKHTTQNGVFGAKVLFDGQASWALEFEPVRALFRTSHLIWLTRQDIIAQAVSRHVARATGEWTAGRAERRGQDREVPYDQAVLENLVADTAQQNRRWLEFFSVNGFDFYSVTYEQLVDETNSVCHDICKYCGVSADHEFSIEKSSVRRQDSRIKGDLHERYRRSSALNVQSGPQGVNGNVVRQGVRLFEQRETAPPPSSRPDGEAPATGPDFIGIGAQKSATTFVFEVLKSHPRVGFPATPERVMAPPIELNGRKIVTWPKEVQFIDGPNSSMSWKEYVNLFDGKQPGTVYGEISPAYLVAPKARIEELRENVPDVRLFAILRDPVERDWSAIRMVAARRGDLDDAAALKSIAEWRQIKVHGDYVRCLQNWLSVFPSEQLLVLPYELLLSDRRRFFESLCEHLGVAADANLGEDQAPVFQGPPMDLPAEVESLLRKRHEDAVEELRDLLGLDLSTYWSHGEPAAATPAQVPSRNS